MSRVMRCQHCYTRIATCIGEGSGAPGRSLACDMCCQHGDHCEQLFERKGNGDPDFKNPTAVGLEFGA